MKLTDKERKIKRPAWATRLAAVRIRTGLNASEFARALGFSQQRYDNYEQGKNEPNTAVWNLLKRELGEEIYFVITGEQLEQRPLRGPRLERSQVTEPAKRAKGGMFSDAFLSRAANLIAACRAAEITLATAESCTGGLLAALITAIPGSSDVFERGFVTYSNAAKIECLGVSPRTLEIFGAVSAEAARAMAEGALAHSSAAGVAVSITGIAGPAGGSPGKPVGLVHFGLARRGGAIVAVEKRFGDLGRDGVRSGAVAMAIELLLEAAC
jgi:nicotinamide-nucleotide amidase